MKKYLIVAAALAAVSAPAAAEIGGGRVEVLGGWDNPIADLGNGLSPIDEDGLLYGVGAGYDFALNEKFAVGIDAEATLSTSEFKMGDEIDGFEIDAKRDLYVGGRVTAAVADNFNLYAKAGYTNARLRGRFYDGGDVTVENANADGIRAGIGGQILIGEQAYVGMEYRYSNYEGDLTRNQLVASLGFRF